MGGVHLVGFIDSSQIGAIETARIVIAHLHTVYNEFLVYIQILEVDIEVSFSIPLQYNPSGS